MNRVLHCSFVCGMALAVFGCGAPPAQQNGAGSDPQATAESFGVVSSQPDAQGQAPAPPPGDTSAYIIPGSPGQGGIAGQPLGGADPAAEATPTNWQTYADEQFGFAVTYPDTYVILEQPSPRETPAPGVVHQVQFQDKTLATGDTAALEPPQFRIEVFEKPADITLEQWLDGNAEGAATPIALGELNGYQVSLNTMQAPNRFYYTASDTHIYRLTPLGPYAEEMLESFKVGAG